MKKIAISILLISFFLLSCRDSYDPPVVSSKQTFLVVEANLDPGPRASYVLLTRTSGLEARSTTVVRENTAIVTVEGKDNSSRTLRAIGRGLYESTNLNLVIGNEYRLRIRVGGKDYQSEYIRARKTPPMDSIGWDREKDGMQVHVSTKDPTAQSQYYKWDYDETWEIRSQFSSTFIYSPQTRSVRNRILPQEDVSVCWRYDTSSTIILANSTRLVSDVIYKAPLVFIPNRSDKLSVRYSIKVRQYALDRLAYNFFELMRKNTEEIGSVFSPQPSEVRGNITCTSDPSEYVLGYVTASTVEEQRVFIKVPWDFILSCNEVVSPNNPDSLEFYFGIGGYIPYAFNDPPPSYSGATSSCVDCRLRGGSTVKPSFW